MHIFQQTTIKNSYTIPQSADLKCLLGFSRDELRLEHGGHLLFDEKLLQTFLIAGIEAVICIKKNDLISLHITELGAWEEPIVNNVVKVLSMFKNATFLGKLFFRFTK